MSLRQNKQPSIRFDLAGPYGFQGISFEPKVITFQLDEISATSDNDFWAAPAGTLIAQAFIRAEAAVTGGTVTLGTDGDPDALINTTDFDATGTDNWATNIGSGTAAAANGLYLPAGDNIRLAVGGTPTAGAVQGVIIYYELDAMFAEGIHFDI